MQILINYQGADKSRIRNLLCEYKSTKELATCRTTEMHKSQRLQWFVHIQRTNDSRIPKKILISKVNNTRRRPKMRWMDNFTDDLQTMRSWCRSTVAEAKGHPGVKRSLARFGYKVEKKPPRVALYLNHQIKEWELRRGSLNNPTIYLTGPSIFPFLLLWARLYGHRRHVSCQINTPPWPDTRGTIHFQYLARAKEQVIFWSFTSQ